MERSRARYRVASIAVAVLVAAIVVVPAVAIESRTGEAPDVLALAVGTHKPKPNPKPTPTPIPTPTPRITPRPKPPPAATPRPTQRPASATSQPVDTPAPIHSPAAAASPTPFAIFAFGGAGGSGSGGTSSTTRPTGSGALFLVFVSLGLAMVAGIVLLTIARKPRGTRSPSLAVAGAVAPSSHGRGSNPTWPSSGEDESSIPGWLRPSVRAAYFWAPKAPVPTDESSTRSTLTFNQPAANSIKRMEIRNDGVRLLDQRNETYASILARLGSGDEVDVHRVDDGWALVETPHGLTGWLPAANLTKATARRAVVEADDVAAVDAATAAAVRPTARRRFPLGRRIAKATDPEPRSIAEVPWD